MIKSRTGTVVSIAPPRVATDGEQVFAVKVAIAVKLRSGYTKITHQTVFSESRPEIGEQISVDVVQTWDSKRPLDDWELEEFNRLKAVGFL